MKSKEIKILAIESSCDETAASVIGVENGQPKILSNIVSSQVDLHALTGGVVPEVASRAHVENIVPVISEALITASQRNPKSEILISKQIQNIKLDELYKLATLELKSIDFVAVTSGPGLIGSLLVGFNASKTLAYALDKPIVPINHIEGHIYSALGRIELPITNNQLPIKSQIPNPKSQKGRSPTEFDFPILALTVSGGHTSLTLMHDHGEYETLGETIDDAAGEAFDKVAKLLELGYPGGPIVSKYAGQFREKSIIKSEIIFPRPILNDGTFNFSFSGLKTSVLQKVIDLRKQHGENISEEIKQEVCAAFEDAVVDVLVTKTMRAVEKHEPKAVILAGGVAANRTLRNTLELKIVNCKLKIDFLVPPMNLCGDNAAMIGLAAYYHIVRGDVSGWNDIEVDSNLELKSDNS